MRSDTGRSAGHPARPDAPGRGRRAGGGGAARAVDRVAGGSPFARRGHGAHPGRAHASVCVPPGLADGGVPGRVRDRVRPVAGERAAPRGCGAAGRAVHGRRPPVPVRAAAAAGLLEVGVIMAAVRRTPAGTLPRSLLFLTVIRGGAVRRADRRVGQPLPRVDGRARPAAGDRAGPAGGDAAAASAPGSPGSCTTSCRTACRSSSPWPTRPRRLPVRPGAGRRRWPRSPRSAGRPWPTCDDARGAARPEPAPELEPQPGVAESGRCPSGSGRPGCEVDDIEGVPFPLGAAAELTVYRIVQEALTNTLRHAPASRASVAIGTTRRWCMRVRDDGTASPPRRHAARTRNRRDARAGGAARGHPAAPAPRPAAAGRSRRPALRSAAGQAA